MKLSIQANRMMKSDARKFRSFITARLADYVTAAALPLEEGASRPFGGAQRAPCFRRNGWLSLIVPHGRSDERGRSAKQKHKRCDRDGTVEQAAPAASIKER